MTPSKLVPSCAVAIVLLFTLARPPISAAQTDVEIEIAGPWSYVLDPVHSGRIAVVAPVGHVMAIFTGGDITQYPGVPGMQTAGSHELDFATFPCGPMPSSFYLYPANGVNQQTIQNAVSSASTYSLSLPKPCYYESRTESVFKYNGLTAVGAGDTERGFTTVMSLHYQVPSPTPSAVLDNGTLKPIAFALNSARPRAISVTLYLDTEPDKRCDSHSANAFDATLSLWGLSQVYRVFPKLSYNEGDNYNQQIPGSYDYTCPTVHGLLASTPAPNQKGEAHSAANVAQNRAPGRADCHAAQTNVNGAVN